MRGVKPIAFLGNFANLARLSIFENDVIALYAMDCGKHVAIEVPAPL